MRLGRSQPDPSKRGQSPIYQVGRKCDEEFYEALYGVIINPNSDDMLRLDEQVQLVSGYNQSSYFIDSILKHIPIPKILIDAHAAFRRQQKDENCSIYFQGRPPCR